jgi:hypothetical protein
MTLYADLAAGLDDAQSVRVQEVMALLALAPRSGGTAWTGQDLRQWVELIRWVERPEIEQALDKAVRWGAGPTDVVPAAAHIVLTQLALALPGERAARARSNILSVCDHLHDHVGRAVAGRLPRVQPAVGPLEDVVVWAYFFFCLAFLLMAVVVTR